MINWKLIFDISCLIKGFCIGAMVGKSSLIFPILFGLTTVSMVVAVKMDCW